MPGSGWQRSPRGVPSAGDDTMKLELEAHRKLTRCSNAHLRTNTQLLPFHLMSTQTLSMHKRRERYWCAPWIFLNSWSSYFNSDRAFSYWVEGGHFLLGQCRKHWRPRSGGGESQRSAGQARPWEATARMLCGKWQGHCSDLRPTLRVGHHLPNCRGHQGRRRWEADTSKAGPCPGRCGAHCRQGEGHIVATWYYKTLRQLA